MGELIEGYTLKSRTSCKVTAYQFAATNGSKPLAFAMPMKNCRLFSRSRQNFTSNKLIGNSRNSISKR